jgi:hypothetical protein
MKEERGFRYFNFNGGDSWAYYQSVDDPRFVFNFKGEPTYLLEEVAPGFWKELQDAKRAEAQATHEYFSFISPQSDTIFNAILDKQTQDLQLMPCGNERRAQLFLENHGLFLPDILPTYDMIYDPQGTYVVDKDTRLINTYRAPFFEDRSVTGPPQIIINLIGHAIGEGDILAWFLHWLRAIAVEKIHTGVAVIAHGSFGTGKGVLANRVITPLVGAHNAAMINGQRLLEQYNGWMENKLFVGVDEIDTESLGSSARLVEANLKAWVTEPTVPVRVMRQNPRIVKNYTNWMLMSNQPSPALINTGDRRYQIGRYQPNKINLSAGDIAAIDAAVPDMFSWLRSQQPAASGLLRKILETKDRELLIDLNKTTIDSVSEHLLLGDLDFFYTQLPASKTFDTDPGGGQSDEERALAAYKQALHVMTLRAINKPDKSYVTREELFAVLNYLAGNIRRAPHHFSSLLKHHRLYLSPESPDGRKGYCLPVQWKTTSEWCVKALRDHLPDIGPKADLKDVA